MDFKFSNKVYDTLKRIALIILPALATAYFGIAQIWGLPYSEQIVGTLSVIDAFLGAILGISTHNYNLQLLKETNNEADS